VKLALPAMKARVRSGVIPSGMELPSWTSRSRSAGVASAAEKGA
jgi:hypothetical protein